MMNVGGLPSLLKEGTKHLSGVEEACLRNIEASKQLYHIVRSSMGPNGTSAACLLSTHLLALAIGGMIDMPAGRCSKMASHFRHEQDGD